MARWTRLGIARHEVRRAKLMGTGGIVTGQIDVWLRIVLGFRLETTKRMPVADRSDESIALRESIRPAVLRLAASPQKRIDV